MFPIIFILNILAGTNRNRFLVHSIPLTAFNRKLDWQASGICVASDGNCYFACSTHAPDCGAAFFQYVRRKQELKLLCDDITSVCNENPRSTPPQGKIRSDIVELDGWLYFGTHLGNYWAEAEAAYTGGHVVGYELASGRFRDFGVVRAKFTIFSAVAADPLRARLYVHTTRYPRGPSSHLYSIDVQRGVKTDLGSIHARTGYVHYIFVDGHGNCWFSSTGASGVLLNYDTTKQQLLQWANKLPPLYSWQMEEGGCPTRAMTWVGRLDDFRCVFTMEGMFGTSGDTLWLLDTRTGKNGSIHAVGIHGQTAFGMCYCSGRVYYVQNSYAKVSPRIGAMVIRRIQAKVVAKLIILNAEPGLRLRSISVDNGTINDYGLIVDQNGQKPARIDSIAINDNGEVFMVGEWRMPCREDRSLLYEHRSRSYRELPTGQSFAIGFLRP